MLAADPILALARRGGRVQQTLQSDVLSAYKALYYTNN